MEILADMTIQKIRKSKIQEVDFENLEFGKYISDHMLVCDYEYGHWNTPHIVPVGNLSLHPATLALHYGQTVFEGMKAFRMQDGRINIFRIEKHYDRLAKSLDRMCMAVPPKEIFEEGLKKLVELDMEWVPKKAGQALYLRPFVYASEAKFGIKISEQYRFVIFTGPVAELYTQPIKVKVEQQYTRAAKGGTGFAKCGGNYGGAYYPTKLAREQGYNQVLWTDGRENKFIEESGSMNVVFVINNKIITAPLSDSILDGITRDSLIRLAATMGIAVEERPIAVDELESAFQKGFITEAFGAGTAAVVAPIQLIGIDGIDYTLPDYNDNSLHRILKQKLENIRKGIEQDIFEWNHIV